MKKRSKWIAAAGLLALAGGIGTVVADTDKAAANLEGTVHVAGLHVDTFKSDRIVLDTNAEIQVSRALTVERVEFSDMKINGVPFTIAPITQEVQLPKSSPHTLSGLQIDLLFRDLGTTDPWRQLAANKNVRITGSVTIQPKHGFLARLAPGGRQPITLHLDDALSVQFGLIPWKQQNQS
jgi:hypothetical protein